MVKATDGWGRWESTLSPWQRGLAAALLTTCLWTLLYYFFLLAPLGWRLRTAETVGLAGGAAIGMLSRGISERFWPVAVGVALGITFGGAKAWVTDTITTPWDDLILPLRGMAPYPAYVWLISSAGWMAADWATGRLRKGPIG